MNEEEKIISGNAVAWVKAHAKGLIDQIAGSANIVCEGMPVTIFMAGSPGAGKTEVSKRLSMKFRDNPVRIDADEIRSMCAGYVGTNAHLFQKAASRGVHVLYDHALKSGMNIILDGTFAYADAILNIERSPSRGRTVEIVFLHQDPVQAWEFTKKREITEGRRVTREVFINAFLRARLNVNEAKSRFGGRLELNVIIKDFDRGTERFEANQDNVDDCVEKLYNREDLELLIV